MKKKFAISTAVCLLALLLALPTCVPRANAAEAKPKEAVYALCLTDGEQVILINAFYVEDTQNDGSTYLMSTGGAQDLIEKGWQVFLMGEDCLEEASYVLSAEGFEFYRTSYLKDAAPLKTGTAFTKRVKCAHVAFEDDHVASPAITELDLSGWVDKGTYRYDPNTKLEDISFMGAPVMETNGYGVVGMISMTQKDNIAVVSMLDLDFPSEAAIVKGSSRTGAESGTKPESGTQPEKPDQTESAPEKADDGGKRTGVFLLAAVIGAVAVLVTRKSTKKKETTASAREGTVSLEEVAPADSAWNTDIKEFRPRPAARFQVRGVGGVMDGRVFPLGTVLRFGRSGQCDVVFPQDTPGISALHCELEVENDQVVLRDAQSTYGTYLSKNVRMEPKVNYHLQPGDVFTLAEGGQSFRLESAGASVQDLTPAVRDAGSGAVYRADLQGRIAFGRGPGNQVAFGAEDTAISAAHCLLYRSGEDLFLMDTGSTNGTFLSEQERLRPQKAYRVAKGQAFFLSSPKYTFVIIEA